MVKRAKRIVDWAFEENAGFFISERSYSFDDKKVVAYFIFKRYRNFGIPLKKEMSLFLEKEKAQEFLNSIVNKN